MKYLGLIIDETLSWRDHVDYIIASLSKFYGIFIDKAFGTKEV